MGAFPPFSIYPHLARLKFSSQKKSRFASDFLRRGNRTSCGLTRVARFFQERLRNRHRNRRGSRDFGALRAEFRSSRERFTTTLGILQPTLFLFLQSILFSKMPIESLSHWSRASTTTDITVCTEMITI